MTRNSDNDQLLSRTYRHSVDERMQMATILWVSAETPDRYGQGGQRRQYHQIAALSQLGHELKVVSLASQQSSESIEKITAIRRMRTSVKGILIPSLVRRLHRLIERDLSETLIVSHVESCGMLPPRFWDDRPKLLDVHNVMSDWLFRRGLSDEAYRSLEAEGAALAQFTSASTCSDLEAQRLRLHHPEFAGRVFSAPLGVDPEEWPNVRYSRLEPIVALFGSWDWLPNQLGLAWFAQDVWPQVVATYPSARALVAGSGVADSEVWPAGMHYVGRAPNLAAFTAQATVVAVPVFEGVGASVKFAESLASGASVAATSDGSNAFTNTPAFVSDDPKSWASWICERLAARDREAVPSPGRQFALHNLTWGSAVIPIHEWLQDNC